MLRVSGVDVHFGGVRALCGIDVEVGPGEIVGLIGSNGAGKSTLLNVIGGFVPATGRIEVAGIDVAGLPPHSRARLGVGRIFQDARLFGSLTVSETVQVALEAHERSELIPSMLGLAPARRSERSRVARADEMIGHLGLRSYRDSPIESLSTGTRRIVELACQLVLSPRLVLMDEPTAGIAQREVEAFGPMIARVREELGAAVLLVEHDIPLICALSDRLYCLGAGAVIASGTPDTVRRDPHVIAAYLGTDARAIERSGAVR